MSTMETSLKVKIVYADATSRNYTFNGISNDEDMRIKANIVALNDSLVAGTADDFKEIFVSDGGASSVSISSAIITHTIQEVIYNAS